MANVDLSKQYNDLKEASNLDQVKAVLLSVCNTLGVPDDYNDEVEVIVWAEINKEVTLAELYLLDNIFSKGKEYGILTK